MAEPVIFKFSFQELAELMARQAGVTEGLWGIWINFGIAGANVGVGAEDLSPAAVVPILEIGLQKFEQPSRLTVDAAELGDPPTRPARRTRARSRGQRATQPSE
jgi:hypothetical protein